MEPNQQHKTVNLEELSKSDFEIAGNQPDILGWEVVDSEGNEIGEVQDLIFDRQEGKVRYIVADIDTDQENHTGYILIPIGIVTLDDDEDEVIVPQKHTEALFSLPPYEKGKTISPVEELAIRYAFLGEGSLPKAEAVVYEQHPDPESFYTHDHFSDKNFRRSRDYMQTENGTQRVDYAQIDDTRLLDDTPGRNYKYGLHGHLKAKTGQGRELSKLLMEASELVARRKGCIFYLVSIEPGNPDLIWVTEAWDSKEDHDNSISDPAAMELINRAIPLMEALPAKGQELMVIGGHGIIWK